MISLVFSDPSNSIAERFYGLTVPEPNTGCLLWIGRLDKDGYGRFDLGGKAYGAHRFTMLLTHGSIPFNLFACHKCDTPACVNPDHIFFGSPKENVDDSIKKGRHLKLRDKCKYGHSVTADNIRMEPDKSRASGFRRRCAICFRAKTDELSARRREQRRLRKQGPPVLDQAGVSL